ncbi:MAG TPA: SRPBCC family protein [Candidatus Saccharimonadales bacterium]|nr:SRPBCC family protein [Candidatus Saccharimonadales bacterium]
MAQRPETMRLAGRCSAPPDAVYDLLSDLRAHLRWGGEEQVANYRLLSLEAPDGPAIAGTVFVTTGSIPMSRRRWQDRSTVTSALRPLAFVFVTDAKVVGSHRPMLARYLHNYAITSCGGGSTVTYELTQERIVNPFLRLRIPVIRTVTWRCAAPLFARRGFFNLLRYAESQMAEAAAPNPRGGELPLDDAGPTGRPKPG